MKSFDKHERKIKAPEVREKKVMNTRRILEDALEEDYFEDEDEEYFEISNQEITETQ